MPDPTTHAYRPDLADIALAGRVIASHYAEALTRTLAEDAQLMASRDDGAEIIATLAAGERFDMLDNSLGWAWGYAGAERRVGYVRAAAIRPRAT